MSSYQQLQARPKRANQIFPLEDHLLDVTRKGQCILNESSKYNESLLNCVIDRKGESILYNVISATHDIGKASKFFQDYIGPFRKNSGRKKAHSPLSAIYAFYAAKKLLESHTNCEKLATLAAICVLAHHGELQSPTITAARLNSMSSIITEQVASIDGSRLAELDNISTTLGLPPFSEFRLQYQNMIRQFVKVQGNLNYRCEDLSQFYSVSHLFSALIDSDRLSAAELDIPNRVSLPFDYITNNINNMQKEGKENANANVAKMREAIFNHVMKKAETVPLSNKIFSLTAPTGSGKTLTGLSFALRLKQRMQSRGLDPRVIYVAPFLSIIDQNFEIFKKAVGKDSSRSDVILAHHHLCEITYRRNEDESYSSDKSELLIEGWNSEIIVTTLVQFAHTILGRRANELRKFHNLAGSIVILDEVQSIPIDYWNLIRKVLKFLCEHYGMTFVLMTATQPLIFDKQEVEELLEGLMPISNEEKCVLDTSCFRKDSSGQIQVMTIDDFANKIVKLLNETEPAPNVMAVLNTIYSASSLFDKIQNKLVNHDVYYLSAEVTPKQRKKRLESIEIQMKQNRENPSITKPLLLITTQLIEAGVDIDFDMVFRDLAPVDSIIQCAGRCNRRGLRSRENSRIVIVKLVDDVGSPFARKVYGNVSIQKTEDILSCYTNQNFRELSDLYYTAIKGLRNQSKEKNLLESVCTLEYDKLDDFKIIEEIPGGSVFIEECPEAITLFQQFQNIWDTEKKERGEARREFLKIRSNFYQYVINIPDTYLSHLNEPIHGIYHVPSTEIPQKYDPEKGFVRNMSGLI